MPTLYSGRCSSHRLDIIIVGGGVAGLSSAFALQNAGHRTTVLDRGPEGTVEEGGGQHISPNAVKILKEWGLMDELMSFSFVAEGIDIILHDTEELVGTTPYDESLVRDSGSNFLLADRADVVMLLRRIAIASGATIRYKTDVADIDPSTNTVETSDGTTLNCDLIIGADGAYSRIRRRLFPNSSEIPAPSLCSSVLVEGSLLLKDDQLRPLMQKNCYTVWMGPQRAAWAYPVKNRTAYSMTFHYPSRDEDHELETSESDWKIRPITDDIRRGFSDWGPRFTKLLSMVDSAPTSRRLDIQPLEDLNWPYDYEEPGSESSSRSNIVLVGHAAHPILASGTNGLAMAVEDAAVLGSLLSRYDPSAESTSLRALLAAYTAIRQGRAAECMASEVDRLKMAMVDPKSSAAKKRNEWIAETAKEQHFLHGNFADALMALWGYHAVDEAEEWWSLWKLPGERSEAAVDPNATAVAGELQVQGRGKRLNSVSIGVTMDTVVSDHT